MTLTDAELAAELAEEAGKLLLEVRDELGFYDRRALGAAGDRRANALILGRLRDERPDDGVLSEEAHDDLARLRLDRVWIIDPLDGTREFSTPGRDDWAVHVALWQDGREITDAAVALPALGELYRSDTVSAATGFGAADRPIRVAVSATRAPSLVYWISEIVAIQPVPIGSAGAKAMAVVRGDVDAYLHAGGQWEWDSAAPAGVMWAAGLHASRLDGSPLRYNEPEPYLPDLLMCRTEVAGMLLQAIRRAVM
ncbi:3'(2'),5'-bisphosphate nucleotidase CysQ [Mycobacterium sp.]|uniref:3'(2'),5'-bisphosphate nucleotidase CysQ n=1 Tax=Mycobacterium sp. TaxID=1785 RepID=UPI002B5F3CFF|nr:3'(2'),5'-bisphosphate nucleotidase CysQ [Mycobacterium sp.]HME47079.1 3'(2'),5'-bisphosphate nucleotidase CysQ [Mycobacterium sp.]